MDKKDMTFAGSGMLSEGEYGKVLFAGSGKIVGNVTCDELTGHGSLRAEGDITCPGTIECNGSFHCEGNLAADFLNLSGGSHVVGDMQVNRMTAAGAVKVDGAISGGKLDCAGSIKAEGGFLSGELRTAGSARIGSDFHGDSLDVSGGLTIEGDCEVEKFMAGGRVEITGLLNAGELQIELGHRDCTVGSIGGDKITVKQGTSIYNILRNNEYVGDAMGELTGAVKGLLNRMGLDNVTQAAKSAVELGTLTTSVIEGDEIYLENTVAETVRGATVTIGPKCKIGRVEYSGTCEIDPSATVDESVKM